MDLVPGLRVGVNGGVSDLRAQGAFLWMREAPASMYSFLDIHICWKDPKDDKIEPPVRVRT